MTKRIIRPRLAQTACRATPASHARAKSKPLCGAAQAGQARAPDAAADGQVLEGFLFSPARRAHACVGEHKAAGVGRGEATLAAAAGVNGTHASVGRKKGGGQSHEWVEAFQGVATNRRVVAAPRAAPKAFSITKL